MTDRAARFAATCAALFAAHHVGDYWVQTNHQAATKGLRGPVGRRACVAHAATYTATTAVAVVAADRVLRLGVDWRVAVVGQVVSAFTHYAADRREYGLMFWVADRLERRTGKRTYLDSGGQPLLDQAWHVAALAVAAGVTAIGAD